MRTSNSKLVSTILISGMSMIISYIINLLVTPYITERLGIEAYGFVSIAKSAVSYATIITVALTSFVVRFISVSYHSGDMREARGYYASSVAASAVLSGIIYVLVLGTVSKLEYILNIPSVLVSGVKILFIIVFFNFVLTTISIPLGAAFYIKNRMDILGIIKTIAYICDAMVLLGLFLVFSPSIWFTGVGSVTATVVILILDRIITKRLTPELQFRREWVSLKKVKTLMHNGVWNSLNSLGNTLNSGLDLLISNLLLTGEAMGQIAVVKTIHTMFSALYQVIFQPLQPQLIKTYAQKNVDAFVDELKKAMRICGGVASLAFAGFFALGKVYYRLWLPGEDTWLLYNLTVITVLISITEGIMQPVYYVNTLTLKNRLPCWITIAGGVVNVVAMYFLLTYTSLGPFAVVGTTTFVMLGINLFFNPVYSAKCLGIRSGTLYRTLIRHFAATGVMVAALWLMGEILQPNTWIGFFLCILPMAVVGGVIYVLLVSSREERKKLWEKVKQILHRSGRDPVSE